MTMQELNKAEYPYNLLIAIGRLRSSEYLENIYDADFELYDDAEITFPADLLGSLEYVLCSLSDRERKILKYRYEDGLNLEETGKNFGVTRGRIGQIEAKALRKLRHPTRYNFLKYGIIGTIEKRAEIIASKQIELARAEGYRDGYEKCRENFMELENEKQESAAADDRKPVNTARLNCLFDKDISELNLSVRSYNCLKRANVNTVSQLADMSKHQLYRLRNMGRKSVEEIVSKMENAGFTIPDRKYDEE